MIKPDETRRWRLQRELEQNYTSLPSIVCDDFFNAYSRSLFAGKRIDANNNNNNNKGAICCQISQLEETTTRTGRRVLRRKLTQLKEEEDDDEEHLDDDHLMDGHKGHAHQVVDNSTREQDDFVMFLRAQAAASKRARKSETKIRIYRTPPAASDPKMGVSSGNLRKKESISKVKEDEGGGVKCFELFCIHQSSLLVHRSQVLVEAQRLANRLARLQAAGLNYHR